MTRSLSRGRLGWRLFGSAWVWRRRWARTRRRHAHQRAHQRAHHPAATPPPYPPPYPPPPRRRLLLDSAGGGEAAGAGGRDLDGAVRAGHPPAARAQAVQGGGEGLRRAGEGRDHGSRSISARFTYDGGRFSSQVRADEEQERRRKAADDQRQKGVTMDAPKGETAIINKPTVGYASRSQLTYDLGEADLGRRAVFLMLAPVGTSATSTSRCSRLDGSPVSCAR